MLKELADENRRLKQMYAHLSLKHDALNDMTPVEYLQANNPPGNSILAWD